VSVNHRLVCYFFSDSALFTPHSSLKYQFLKIRKPVIISSSIIITTDGCQLPPLNDIKYFPASLFCFICRAERIVFQTVFNNKNIVTGKESFIKDIECEARGVTVNVKTLYIFKDKIFSKRLIKGEPTADSML